jgi:hypothetical protein
VVHRAEPEQSSQCPVPIPLPHNGYIEVSSSPWVTGPSAMPPAGALWLWDGREPGADPGVAGGSRADLSRPQTTRAKPSSPARGCPARSSGRALQLDTPGPDCTPRGGSTAHGTDRGWWMRWRAGNARSTNDPRSISPGKQRVTTGTSGHQVSPAATAGNGR